MPWAIELVLLVGPHFLITSPSSEKSRCSFPDLRGHLKNRNALVRNAFKSRNKIMEEAWQEKMLM